MKNVTKLVVGAAMAAASIGAANAAITVPSTGDSQLLFFVNDLTAHSTYTAEVTLNQGTASASTINLSSYLSQANAASGSAGTITTISGDASFSENFSGDTALTSFISGAGSDTLQWGLLSGASNGTVGANKTAVGGSLFLATGVGLPTSPQTSETNMTGTAQSNYVSDVKGFNAQNATLDAYNGSTNGIFGTSKSKNNTPLTLEGAGYNQGGAALDGSAFSVYGFSSTGQPNGFTADFLLGTASFNAATGILNFTGAAAPLPAGAWLFGSGLLGLMGIGRRRKA